MVTDSNCVDIVLEELDTGKRFCPCNVDCMETDYETSLSSSTWPAKGFQVQPYLNCLLRVLDFNLNKSISTLKGNFSSLQERLAKLHTGGDKTRIRDNFLKIGVYFQTLNTKNIVEDKKYTVSSKRI